MTDRLVRARGFLRERLGGPETPPRMIAGGPVLVRLGAVLGFCSSRAVTVLALAAF